MLCPIVHERTTFFELGSTLIGSNSLILVFVRQSGLPNASSVRRSNETASAGELRPLIRTPDGGGVFQPGVPALDTAKHRRVQVSQPRVVPGTFVQRGEASSGSRNEHIGVTRDLKVR